jgi:hypothetical protein
LKSVRTSSPIDVPHEEFERRIKTQTVPPPELVERGAYSGNVLWVLLASRWNSLRKREVGEAAMKVTRPEYLADWVNSSRRRSRKINCNTNRGGTELFRGVELYLW